MPLNAVAPLTDAVVEGCQGSHAQVITLFCDGPRLIILMPHFHDDDGHHYHSSIDESFDHQEDFHDMTGCHIDAFLCQPDELDDDICAGVVSAKAYRRSSRRHIERMITFSCDTSHRGSHLAVSPLSDNR